MTDVMEAGEAVAPAQDNNHGELDYVAMIITMKDDDGLYEVLNDDRSAFMLRQLLSAMIQSGPLNMRRIGTVANEPVVVSEAPETVQ